MAEYTWQESNLRLRIWSPLLYLKIDLSTCGKFYYLFFQLMMPNFGVLRLMAPGFGQTSTQHPSYQHSPGKRTIGGRPFSGFGIRISTWQTSTHLLHPLHNSELKTRGSGTACNWWGDTFFFSIYPSLLRHLCCGLCNFPQVSRNNLWIFHRFGFPHLFV